MRIALAVAAAALVACSGSSSTGMGGGSGGMGGSGVGGGAANQAPTAAFVPPSGVIQNMAAAFTGTGSDPDGDTLQFSWDFGDGVRGGGAQVAHVFTTSGPFTVKLTVADGRGGTATAAQSVTVAAGPAPGAAVAVSAIVTDLANAPLAGVTLKHVGGTATATTGADGKASLPLPTGVPQRVACTKPGYTDQWVEVRLPTGATSGHFATQLKARAAAQMLDATTGGSVTAADGAKLTIPAGALRTVAGAVVAGPIQVSVTPVDVVAQTLAFPGSFTGVEPDGTQRPIVSYGTVEFVLQQNGQQVDLAPGARATIELPIYAGTNLDGTLVAAGATIPLWSLDEKSGTWTREGQGTVVASTAAPNALALRGDVGHFSWWNADKLSAPLGTVKPKCCIDGDADGMCDGNGSAAYCWVRGTTNCPSDFGSCGKAIASLPATAAYATSDPNAPPSLDVPANVDIYFFGSIGGGTHVGTKILATATGGSTDLVIPCRPAVASNTLLAVPSTTNGAIAMPGELDRYDVDLTAGAQLHVLIARAVGSSLAGSVKVTAPGGRTWGPVAFGSTMPRFGIAAPVAGRYAIEVGGTGAAVGGYVLTLAATGPSPVFLGMTPANGARGVSPATAIDALFSVPMAQPTAANFKVTRAFSPLAIPGTYSLVGNAIRFTPAAPLDLANPYTVTLGTGLLSGTGSPLTVAEQQGFVVRDVPQGQKMLLLSNVDVDALTVASDGAAFAFFRTGVLPSVSRYVVDAGWDPPSVLSDAGFGSNGYPFSPRLVALPQGRVMAIYAQDDPGAAPQPRSIWAALFDPAMGWGPAARIEASSAAMASPAGAADQSGNVVVAWSAGATQEIWANRFTPAGGWGTAAVVAGDAGTMLSRLEVASNPTGDALVAWVASSTVGPDVHTVRYRNAAWGAHELAENQAGAVDAPAPVVDPSGTAWLSWGESNAGFWLARAAPASPWSTPQLLWSTNQSIIGFSCYGTNALHHAPTGDLLAVGCRSDPSNVLGPVALIAPTDGGAPGPVTLLSDGGFNVMAASWTGAGEAFAVWNASSITAPLRTSAFRADAGWAAPADLPGTLSGTGVMASSAAGAYAAWYDSTDGAWYVAKVR